MHSSYSLRPRRGSSAPPPTGAGIPDGYTRLDVFNSTVNKYGGKYSGLVGQPVDETEIWVKEYKGKILLWWTKPKLQIDDFTYFGDGQQDIEACNAEMAQHMRGISGSYTWHHTGYPIEESGGTMQLVPTNEHSSLPHIGGAAISKGTY